MWDKREQGRALASPSFLSSAYICLLLFKDVSSCLEGGKLMEEFVSQLRFDCAEAFLSNLFSLSGSLPTGGEFPL